jgi:predicted RNase H-like HicB family nuclease
MEAQMLKTKTKRTIKKQIDTRFKLTITAELTPDEAEGGYVVYCPELDIYTQGETVEECIENLQEAATGYIKVVGLENLKLRQKPVIRKEVEVTVCA